MEEKMTMEITNDRLEEAIKEYAADRTKERLTTVLNLLRPTKLFVPAMLQAPDRRRTRPGDRNLGLAWQCDATCPSRRRA